jgi:hypothetical protein
MDAEESRRQQGLGRRVKLNVYDLIPESNKFLSFVGVGAYHSGVEVEGREWTFSESGVFFTKPLEANCGAFKSTIDLGEHRGSPSDFNAIIADLRKEFPEGSYDLVKRNCNHFANALSQRLVQKQIPSWVNRAASFGSSLLPKPKPTIERKEKTKAEIKADEEKKNARPELTDKQREILAKLKGGKK